MDLDLKLSPLGAGSYVNITEKNRELYWQNLSLTRKIHEWVIW